MTDQARTTEHEGVLTFTLTRPEKLNAITREISDALRVATEAFGNREDLRVMVITGTGRFFSAGSDMEGEYPAGNDVESPDRSHVQWRRRYRAFHLLYDEIEAIEKPVILAAQGSCYGGGLELACSCDFRVSTPEARWALPEIKMGMIPGSGGISRLTSLVGPAWAKWLAMTGEPIDAEMARSIGLIQAIYPAATFADDVAAFAASLAQLSPEALGLAKLTIGMAAAQDREKARNVERLANSQLLVGRLDNIMNNFAAKRGRTRGGSE